MPSTGTQPILNQCWLRQGNQTIFQMPSNGSLRSKHIGWPHVLCDLGFLNNIATISSVLSQSFQTQIVISQYYLSTFLVLSQYFISTLSVLSQYFISTFSVLSQFFANTLSVLYWYLIITLSIISQYCLNTSSVLS